MTFTGSFAAVNTALPGMSFNPTTSFTGAASLQIVTADQGNTGSGGTLTDTDTIAITVASRKFAVEGAAQERTATGGRRGARPPGRATGDQPHLHLLLNTKWVRARSRARSLSG